MKPAPLEYLAVSTAEEALAALAGFDGSARLLAGGQSLVPLLSMRLLRPTAVIDINGISGLDRITAGDGAVRVGALARYAALERSSVIRERVPLLARAVPFVGDPQIRNRGTLGGALCHADPAGEMALCAVTLDARLHIAGPGGRRELDAETFFQGPYATALEPTEMLEAVEFPDGAGTEAVVVEHARRHGDFAVVSVAAAGLPAPDGSWRWIRIGLGAVADRARYARRASEGLAGTRLEPADVEAAAARCLEETEPASDVRASAEYRRHLVPILVERALGALAQRPRDTSCGESEARHGSAGARPSAGGPGAISGPPGSMIVRVNGRGYERVVESRRLLVDFLRHELALHGTHVGCEQGVCGACTVLLDGEPVKSCLMLAPQAHGRSITTVEGLAGRGDLHPVQEAFRDAHALQCGYCTPGFLLAAVALADRGVVLEGADLREELAGNLCRCTGYQNIVEAVARYLRQAAAGRRDG